MVLHLSQNFIWYCAYSNRGEAIFRVSADVSRIDGVFSMSALQRFFMIALFAAWFAINLRRQRKLDHPCSERVAPTGNSVGNGGHCGRPIIIRAGRRAGSAASLAEARSSTPKACRGFGYRSPRRHANRTRRCRK